MTVSSDEGCFFQSSFCPSENRGGLYWGGQKRLISPGVTGLFEKYLVPLK